MSKALALSHGAFGRAAIYALNRTITTHAHREGHLIFNIADTPSMARVGRTDVLCEARTAAAVSPWEPHSFHPLSVEAALVLVLYIKPMWFLEHTNSAEFALSFGTKRLALTPDISHLVRRLSVLMMEDSSALEVEALLFDLTRRCYGHSWKTATERPCRMPRPRLSDYRVRRSQKLMRDCVCDAQGVDAIAAEVGLSRPHFFKLFKQQTGVTPNIYFNTLRSEQAIEDLTASAKSVTEIGLDLGFSSQASFTRFFSLNVGISPTDYRRAAQVH